jgi:hypothetical protein
MKSCIGNISGFGIKASELGNFFSIRIHRIQFSRIKIRSGSADSIPDTLENTRPPRITSREYRDFREFGELAENFEPGDNLSRPGILSE